MNYVLNGEVMRIKNPVLLIAVATFALLLMNSVNAAIIHGTVYDILLEPEYDIKLQINTLPKQVFISKDGQYSFNVPIGNYTIIAETIDGYASEDIIVEDNSGDYVIDIILEQVLTNIESPELNNNDITTNNIGDSFNDSSPVGSSDSSFINVVVGFVLVLLLTVLIVSLFILKDYSFAEIFRKAKKTESQKETEDSGKKDNEKKIIEGYGFDILDLVKKNSPITQRELRKHIPLSEAKISLIIAELEHDGKIKKIKKGRGNILTFIKD